MDSYLAEEEVVPFKMLRQIRELSSRLEQDHC
jgi:hypothetical protein